MLAGSDQERARRPGMENLAAIYALGEVCGHLTTSARHDAGQQLRQTGQIRAGLANDPVMSVVGPDTPEQRLPHMVSFRIDGIEPQGVVVGLDRSGFAVHSGSSCATEDFEPSPVLAAMALSGDAVRVSVGWSTTDDDVTQFLGALRKVVQELQSLS
ncbi:MAG: cysteine desulfurase [Candidatus Poriferisodalaceae bacterium]|jgi:cysteine desulfurase